MFNKAGQVVVLGDGDFSHVYYCGQKLPKALSELMKSSDGWCGPNNGPQCPNCKGMFLANTSANDDGGILLLAMSRMLHFNHRNNIRIRFIES